LANSIVLVQALLTAIFVGLTGFFVCTKNWEWLFLFWLAKTMMDIIFFLPFGLRSDRGLTFLWMPVYEWIYPLYAMTIAISAFVIRPKWKGRTIRVR